MSNSLDIVLPGYLFTQAHFTLKFSIRDLQLFPWLTTLGHVTFMNPMWNIHDTILLTFHKLSLKNPRVPPKRDFWNIEISRSHFVGLGQGASNHFFGLSWTILCSIPLSPMIYHLEHAHFILAWDFKSLKIDYMSHIGWHKLTTCYGPICRFRAMLTIFSQ